MQIGVILREAREEQGLTLDHIQDITKIQKRYLVAIEHDDFHALPGRFYARAFIKEYAQAVGLDADVILENFDEETIEQEEEETVPYTRFDRNKQSSSDKSSFLSFLPTVIVVVLIVGIIFVAYILLQKSSSNDDSVETPQENDEIVRQKDSDKQANDDNEEEAEDEEDADDEEVEDESEDENAFKVVEEGEGNSPLSTLDFTYSGDEVTLQLKPTGETYVQVLNSDEQVLFEGSLTADTDVDEIDVSDEERVYLNIGNAPGLSILLNDVEMEYPVDKDQIVHQKMWINLEKAD